MVRIIIKTENTAFTDNPGEVVRILRRVADRFERGEFLDGYTLMDLNGNRVGTVEVTD